MPRISNAKDLHDSASDVSSIGNDDNRYRDNDEDDLSSSGSSSSDSSSDSSSCTSEDGDDNESIEDSDDDDDISTGAGKQNTARKIRATEVKQVQKMSLRETIRVRFWRVIVLVLLIAAGVAVSTSTYFLLERAEEHAFETRYYLFANTIKDASQFHITHMHLAMADLGETITSSASLTNSSFPFVTVPSFEMYGEHARTQSGVEALAFMPLVIKETRKQWDNYSVSHQAWLAESRHIYENAGSIPGTISHNPETSTAYDEGNITSYIYDTDVHGNPVPSPIEGPFLPIWQMSPPPFDPKFVNQNQMQHAFVQSVLPAVSLTREALFSSVSDLSGTSNTAMSEAEHLRFHLALGDDNLTSENAFERPHSLLVQPIFFSINNPHSEIVGTVLAIVPWDLYLTNLLPTGVTGIVCVLRNSCGQAFSYVLEGSEAHYLGESDQRDPHYSYTEVQVPLRRYVDNRTGLVSGHCEYTLYVYASDQYRWKEASAIPIIFTTIVAVTFAVVVLTFIVYDIFVQRRNSKVVNAAARSNAILSSLFPTNVRDRLIAETEAAAKASNKASKLGGGGISGQKTVAKSRLRSFLDSDTAGTNGANASGEEQIGYEGKPIADLFPETSVMFADIAGFTAWSSVREPAQVFTLLETLYRAFDEIAKRRRVFKVETIGDCYVAVTGLPDPMKEHAVTMARFARDCLHRTRVLTKKLETTLGPDTGDLEMRMGIHSGQVTGGVLRGERSRFQLFGDTMNTASRIESTSVRGRIQVSQDTADLLIASGKGDWLTLREEKVVAKGKGEMQTYWLSIGENRQSDASTVMDSASQTTDGTEDDSDDIEPVDAGIIEAVAPDAKSAALTNSRTTRLIEWNVDVLLRLLKQIVARRKARSDAASRTDLANETQFELHHAESGKTAIDEVKEIIALPKFDAKVAKNQEDPDNITLPTEVIDQLYDYVSNIAAMYNENAFHNFEHASHVTMSVVKLLSRIVAPFDSEDEDEDAIKTGRTLHDHTYGITSDPLTQFACVFSALIHDADHSGVPNAQLVKERSHIAEFYGGKSVAEQNSVDLAWHLLMDDAYNELRLTIYQTDAELKRFRQLVVNSVMATDIVDKELKTLRNARWAKAFSEESANESSRDAINRKATIVIEHLIQASDVAHTMQHWHIYRKWNERFFLECYKAYRDGRADNDPSTGWYQGEIGFYDFYIIPLAKKLKDCGVFGVSSDEYLNYAVRNRKEWEERGKEVVDEMVEMVNRKYGTLEKKVTIVESSNVKKSVDVLPESAKPKELGPTLSMIGSSKRFLPVPPSRNESIGGS